MPAPLLFGADGGAIKPFFKRLRLAQKVGQVLLRYTCRLVTLLSVDKLSHFSQIDTIFALLTKAFIYDTINLYALLK